MGSHGITWERGVLGGFQEKIPKLLQVILIFLLLLHINRKDAVLSINGMCWEKGPSLGLILLDLVAFHPKNKSKGKDLGTTQTVSKQSQRCLILGSNFQISGSWDTGMLCWLITVLMKLLINRSAGGKPSLEAQNTIGERNKASGLMDWAGIYPFPLGITAAAPGGCWRWAGQEGSSCSSGSHCLMLFFCL